MKKIFLIMSLLLVLVGCSSKTDESNKKSELKTIKVASHTEPMTTILELIKDDLKTEGYNLEVVPVTDNVQANVALNNKEVDANFFQHRPFMLEFNKGNSANLETATTVYNALVAFYGREIKNIEELKNKALVAIPNDPTNQARALRLLASSGLIKLDNPENLLAKLENIKENPKNLKFLEVGLLNLNQAYKEADLTFNYPTYIDELGLKPEVDGLIMEPQADQTFAITVAARKDNVDSEEIKALVKHINSEKVKNFINEKLKGHAKPAF